MHLVNIISIDRNKNKKKIENEEDTLPKDPEQGVFLNKTKKDDCKRRPSLAQKMTSNLRRFSGAQNNEHKIDISEPSPTNNPKFCHKKIKVSEKFDRIIFHNTPIILKCPTETQHSRNDGRGKCYSTSSGNTSTYH